jgi:signal recognition particle subunit SRP54
VFETLTSRLSDIFEQLRRRGKLGEADVDSVLREVRRALLEADVNFAVVRDLISRVRTRAVGAEVSRALNPAQQVIKVVHEELIETLGPAAPLQLLGAKPRVLMLVGLQGAGKTTVAGKIARKLQAAGERVLLAACDPYRPAAAEQLRQLGQRLGVEVFMAPELTPWDVAENARKTASDGGYGILILDTAGRSQLSDEMMDELVRLEGAVEPTETLLVLDAMTGQEAVAIAQGFRTKIKVSGLVLTKMDGDARGGGAISVRAVTGIPLKFLGTGEKLDALEEYDPARIASRILGMGDIIGLIERAEAATDEGTARRQVERMQDGRFDLDDWLAQLRQVRRLGPLGQIAEMLPAGAGVTAVQADPAELERSLKMSEAIICSMTTGERRDPDILNASRRRRIARGSGTDVQAVNSLVKQYRQAQRLLKAMKGGSTRKLMGMLGQGQ